MAVTKVAATATAAAIPTKQNSCPGLPMHWKTMTTAKKNPFIDHSIRRHANVLRMNSEQRECKTKRHTTTLCHSFSLSCERERASERAKTKAKGRNCSQWVRTGHLVIERTLCANERWIEREREREKAMCIHTAMSNAMFGLFPATFDGYCAFKTQNLWHSALAVNATKWPLQRTRGKRRRKSNSLHYLLAVCCTTTFTLVSFIYSYWRIAIVGKPLKE